MTCSPLAGVSVVGSTSLAGSSAPDRILFFFMRLYVYLLYFFFKIYNIGFLAPGKGKEKNIQYCSGDSVLTRAGIFLGLVDEARMSRPIPLRTARKVPRNARKTQIRLEHILGRIKCVKFYTVGRVKTASERVSLLVQSQLETHAGQLSTSAGLGTSGSSVLQYGDTIPETHPTGSTTGIHGLTMHVVDGHPRGSVGRTICLGVVVSAFAHRAAQMGHSTTPIAYQQSIPYSTNMAAVFILGGNAKGRPTYRPVCQLLRCGTTT